MQRDPGDYVDVWRGDEHLGLGIWLGPDAVQTGAGRLAEAGLMLKEPDATQRKAILDGLHFGGWPADACPVPCYSDPRVGIGGTAMAKSKRAKSKPAPETAALPAPVPSPAANVAPAVSEATPEPAPATEAISPPAEAVPEPAPVVAPSPFAPGLAVDEGVVVFAEEPKVAPVAPLSLVVESAPELPCADEIPGVSPLAPVAPSPPPLDLVLADPSATFAVWDAVVSGRVKLARWQGLVVISVTGPVLGRVVPTDRELYSASHGPEHMAPPDRDLEAAKAWLEQRLTSAGVHLL